MGRLREYANATERKRANRRKHAQERLHQIPQVHGEGYTLYQGDALAVVPLLGPYDHCICDPPYEAQAHAFSRRTRAYLEGRSPFAALDFAPMTEAQRRLFRQLACGWILIFAQVEAVGKYQEVLGARYRRPLWWRKKDGSPQYTGDRPGMGYESIVCAWGKPGRSQWNGGGKHGVYEHLIRDGEDRVHLTQKPLPLMRALVRDFTQPGDTILDPFAGAATTGVAALEEGRRFIGIELDAAYFQSACARLAATVRQEKLFPHPATQHTLWA